MSTLDSFTGHACMGGDRVFYGYSITQCWMTVSGRRLVYIHSEWAGSYEYEWKSAGSYEYEASAVTMQNMVTCKLQKYSSMPSTKETCKLLSSTRAETHSSTQSFSNTTVAYLRWAAAVRMDVIILTVQGSQVHTTN